VFATGRDRHGFGRLFLALLLQSGGVVMAAVISIVWLPVSCGMPLIEILRESGAVAGSVVLWSGVNALVTLGMIRVVRWRTRQGFARSSASWLVAASVGVAAAGLALVTSLPLYGALETVAANMLQADPPDICGDPTQFLFLFFAGPTVMAFAALLYIAGEVLGVSVRRQETG